MRNLIYKKYFTVIIVFFAVSHVAYAGFEITEIMYDVDGTDTNREWVEVKNTGTEAEDLSRWYLFTDNTKHALSPQGSSSVPAGSYAVITQNATNFRNDWPNFTGTLFDSSWTGLNNDGETIGLKDPNLSVVSEVTFTASMGGSGTGDSLQKVNGMWISTTPTPGSENKSGPASTSVTTTTDENGVTQPIPKKKEVEVPRINTNIIAQNTVFAGIPFTVDALTTGYNKEPLPMGRFSWNFGDGVTKNEYQHEPFRYSYQYPGEYVVSLSYYRVYPGTVVDASDRMTIKVIPPQISISSVMVGNDHYIELENKSSLEINLSEWSLRGALKTFWIPTNTIILPNQKIRFSEVATSFTDSDSQFVMLMDPTGTLADIYPKKKTDASVSTYRVENNSTIKPAIPQIINLNDVGASAGKAVTTPPSLSIVAWGGLLVVLVLGSVSVFLMRKKDIPDYIEREVRAEDMTIVE